ncbi:MAG TPA: YicC/YloC family endoribonuclease [Vicinamibacterales bacterium]|nr:YicC/YloC family endoribonuclease [Vicinamibacterales bacterium]
MIKSMTGFAALTRDDEAGAVSVSIRAVNHRYLDVQLRMPQSLAPIESRLRSLIQQRIARGRLEVSIGLQMRRKPMFDVEVNDGVLDALGAALDPARERGLIAGPLTPGDLLRFPQAVTVRERDDDIPLEAYAPAIEAAVVDALEALDGMRTVEGGHLRADLDRRRLEVGSMFERAAAAANAGIDALRQRLADRVRELRADALADESAIAQEITRFAGRSDITEELVRFRAHLDHWQALADGPEPCGRKLDFLLQEMNREVNTLGSKAEGPDATEIVVALKAELEKMREQVQNVE